MECSSEASRPKRRKMATPTQTMPRGKRTNWKRVVLEDSLGTSGDSLGLSDIGWIQNAEFKMQNAKKTTVISFCILHFAFCISLNDRFPAPRSPAGSP